MKVYAGKKLFPSPELPIPGEIKRGLNTRFVGKQIHFFVRIDSTNIAARKLAELGANEGTVVIADSQSKGKGRMGRSWQSPPGNLYTSIILRPQISSSSAPQVTLMAAVATAKAIAKTIGANPVRSSPRKRFTPMDIGARVLRGSSQRQIRQRWIANGVNVGIKWPNDILIHGKKVAGILTEMDCEGSTLNFIILGIGVNINAPLKLFPRELLSSITSLREEAGGNISLTQFTRCLYQEIERYYNLWMAKGFSGIGNEYTKLSLLQGKLVQISSFEKITSGEVQGIDEKGALLLRLSNGRVERIMTGNVTLRV